MSLFIYVPLALLAGAAESLLCFNFSAMARALDKASLKSILGLPGLRDGGGGTAE